MLKIHWHAALVALAIPATAGAVPGGKLATLPAGAWVCELPGDAATRPTTVPTENFTIVPDSSYTIAGGEGGTYLLLGDALTMTSGPRRGDRYVLESSGTVRKLDMPANRNLLRCVKAGSIALAPAPAPRPADATASSPTAQ